MARITVVTSSSAPQATWATVATTMLASGSRRVLAPENAGDVAGEAQRDLHAQQDQQHRWRASASCGVERWRLRVVIASQFTMQKTTQAPMMCGSRRIPEWRKAAPMMSCSHTAADGQQGKRCEAGARVRTDDRHRRLRPSSCW